MVKKEVTVKSISGLESKTAALFIQKASRYKSSIMLEKGEKKANAKSLLGILSLGVASGSKIVIIAEGPDETDAVNELEIYLSSRSEESGQ